ncbi:MAG TPA: PH domain-containing protein [Fimbriimonadaceae bacterium]|nr:PH domain-containing protein [Fimbriimonadaceae bacterium]
MRRLHPATIFFRVLDALRAMLLPLIFVMFGRAGRDDAVQELVFGAIAVLSVVPAIFNYLATRFGIEGNSLHVKSGWIWRQKRAIPIERIQNVVVRRSFLESTFGLATLVVETGSSSEAEVKLSVLSLEDAEELRHRLLHGHASTQEVQQQAPPALYHASNTDLIVAGALQNRALFIIGSVIGLNEFIIRDYAEQAISWFDRVPEPVRIGFGSIAILALFTLGWILSILISAAQFYNFRVRRTEKGIQVTHGLFTQLEFLMPVKRIQAIELSLPALFRLFGFGVLRARLMGSITEKVPTGNLPLAPIVRMNQVDRLSSLALGSFSFFNFEYLPVSRLHIRRRFLRSLIFWTVVVAVSSIKWKFAGLAWPVLMILALLLANLRWRKTRYAVTDQHFVGCHGALGLMVAAVPLGAIQTVSTGSSWFQRRLGLADLTLVTAASSHSIPDLDHDTALELQDRLMALSAVAERRGV